MEPPKQFQPIQQNEDPRKVYQDIARNLGTGKYNTIQLEALQIWLNKMVEIYPPRNPDGTLITGDK